MTASEPIAAIEVAADLWQLTLPIHRHNLGSANGFLIRDDDGYVLFDCGADVVECSDAMTGQLDSIGVPYNAIHTLILSHGHGDHAGQAISVGQRTGARILMHERDTVYGVYPNSSDADRQQYADWLRRYGYPEDEVTATLESAATGIRGDRRDLAIPVDQPLVGGEVLAVGRYRFEVRWTPGHTPGSVCLVDREHKVLLCGDHILEVVTPNVSLHPLLTENPLPAYFDSLHDFIRDEIDVVLPGHGPRLPDLTATTLEIERRHASRRAQVLALMTSAPQSPYELSVQIWAKPGRRTWSSLHPHLRRNAVGMIAAHLDLMAESDPGVHSQEEDGTLRYSLDR